MEFYIFNLMTLNTIGMTEKFRQHRSLILLQIVSTQNAAPRSAFVPIYLYNIFFKY